MNHSSLPAFYFSRLAKSPLRRKVSLTSALVGNALRLSPLLKADPGSNLERLVAARPEILDVLVTRFVSANWDTRTRIQRALDHVQTVEDIGGVLDAHPNSSIELMRLNEFDSAYSLVLDQARWQISEGLLVLSLWDATERIYSLSFVLATEPLGRVVYVGGVQGAKLPEVMARYRDFTKAAFGMRPRDFLIEIFRTLCLAVGVKEIRGVSSDNHISRSRRFSTLRPFESEVKLSYDDAWIERGGIYDGRGFFRLRVGPGRRNLDAIPAKKRSIYRKRYDALQKMEASLLTTLSPKGRKYVATDWFRSLETYGTSPRTHDDKAAQAPAAMLSHD